MLGSPTTTGTRPVQIPVVRVTLNGDLTVPAGATGIVLFAHGSGSSRLSPRNRRVAEALQRVGLATLLFDLLTTTEEVADQATGHLRFNISLLSERLIGATEWAASEATTRSLNVGYFGASTGAAAALVAAALRPQLVHAVVSRGGRPDLAGDYLKAVKAPTLLIVGGEDHAVLEMNRTALNSMTVAAKQLRVVPGAGHLFTEPGTLERVSELAQEWFSQYLVTGSPVPGA
jgi:dienelactone hydrolase